MIYAVSLCTPFLWCLYLSFPLSLSWLRAAVVTQLLRGEEERGIPTSPDLFPRSLVSSPLRHPFRTCTFMSVQISAFPLSSSSSLSKSPNRPDSLSFILFLCLPFYFPFLLPSFNSYAPSCFVSTLSKDCFMAFGLFSLLAANMQVASCSPPSRSDWVCRSAYVCVKVCGRVILRVIKTLPS